MASPATAPLTRTQQSGIAEPTGKNEASLSGVSWAAVFGGAFVAAAISLILLALGAGIGLSSVSPWSNAGVSASAIGKAAIAWLVVSEIIASASAAGLGHPASRAARDSSCADRSVRSRVAASVSAADRYHTLCRRSPTAASAEDGPRDDVDLLGSSRASSPRA